MPREVSNREDVIDSRNIIARLDELQEQTHLDEDEGEELSALVSLDNEGRQAVGDESWEDGAILVRDSHFADYAEELARDLGDIPQLLRWPFNCIDWEKAAEELQHDYSQVTLDGVDYWVRS